MLQLTDEQAGCRTFAACCRHGSAAIFCKSDTLDHADLRREAATAMRAVLGRGHAWAPESEMAPSELAEMQATR